jgi:hypothetical protein
MMTFAMIHFYTEWHSLNCIYLPHETLRASVNMVMEPLAVMKQYREWHSHESLLRQPYNRTFALAYYSCPQRGGNWFHAYFNTLIFAVVTNRTLLWQFDTGDSNNTQADCDRILQRASWIPSYYEWANNLALPAPVALKMNTRHTLRTKHFYSREEQRASHQHQVIIFPQIPDVMTQNQNISRVSWWEDPRRLTHSSFRNIFFFQRTVHLDAWSQQTMTKLYSEGLYSLYGMLFRECFRIIVPETTLLDDASSNKGVTIALHSRHATARDDGSNVDGEIQCLERFVPVLASSSCVVYLMSDRPATVARLSEWLAQRNCRGLSIAHDYESLPAGRVEEHGPFAGAAFFVDLQFASRARTAVIGDFSRSSTALLLELIEYDRKFDLHKHGMQDRTEALRLCELPDGPEEGV